MTKQNLLDPLIQQLRNTGKMQNMLYSVIMDLLNYISKRPELHEFAKHLYSQNSEVI